MEKVEAFSWYFVKNKWPDLINRFHIFPIGLLGWLSE